MQNIIDQLIYPNPLLLVGLIGLIFIDLLTGVQKANKLGEATTSRGLRYSFDKGSTYFSLIVSTLIILNITSLADKQHSFQGWLTYPINTLILASSYIEFKSILENLIEINTKNGKQNFIAKVVLTKIHNGLILKFKKL